MATAKSKQDTVQDTVQDTPTLPRKRDANGFELDEHNLPLSGPARAARLAKLGISDPALPQSETDLNAPNLDKIIGDQDNG